MALSFRRVVFGFGVAVGAIAPLLFDGSCQSLGELHSLGLLGWAFILESSLFLGFTELVSFALAGAGPMHTVLAVTFSTRGWTTEISVLGVPLARLVKIGLVGLFEKPLWFLVLFVLWRFVDLFSLVAPLPWVLLSFISIFSRLFHGLNFRLEGQDLFFFN